MENSSIDSYFSGINIIWMDPAIKNSENSTYQFKMKNIKNSKLFAFNNVNDGFKIILAIEFQKTYIIVNSTLSQKLLIFLENNIDTLKIIPELIIFTRNKNNIIFKKFIQLKYTFFDSNFVYDSFKQLIDKFELRSIYSGRNFQKGHFIPCNDIFTFEHINSINDLIFPIKFRKYVEFPSYYDIMNFNQFLIDKFSNDNIDYLINQLFMIKRIPKPTLIKYWIRAYTLQSRFYSEMNQYLLHKYGADYDIYIRVLYYGLENDYIPYYIDSPLYRGAIISTKEIEELQTNKKKSSLPSYICFSKSFLSTSLDYKVALKFMVRKSLESNQNYVLYEIEKGNYIDRKNASNSDTQEFSYFKNEKEILFFPFSSFEVGEIKALEYNKKKYYHIKLYYLGKYEYSLPKIDHNIPETNFTASILRTEIFIKKNIENLFNFNISKYYSPDYQVSQFIQKNLPINNNYCTILTKQLRPPIYDILKEKKKIQEMVVKCGTTPIQYDSYSYTLKEFNFKIKEIDYISKCPVLSCPNSFNYQQFYHYCGGQQKLEIETAKLKCIKCGESNYISNYSFRCIYHGYFGVNADDIINALYAKGNYKVMDLLHWNYLVNKIKNIY